MAPSFTAGLESQICPLARFNGLTDLWLKPRGEKDVKTPSQSLSKPYPAVNDGAIDREDAESLVNKAKIHLGFYCVIRVKYISRLGWRDFGRVT